MRVEKFKAHKSDKLSKIVLENFSYVTYQGLMKTLRNKDVKVNGVRQSKDINLNYNDEVIFYYNDKGSSKLDIVYEDENICVVDKPRKLEVVSDVSHENVKEKLSAELGCECYAVHRLDRNTTGLLIFAKNEKAKESLDYAFKNRTIEKFYLALVCGTFTKKSDDMIAYLKKDAKRSIVKINNFAESGFEKIETKYKVLKEKDNLSLVEVELVTGKTHQIRAHFAFVGHPIVGDEKYGNYEINKLYKLKFQCLSSYKIVFHFDENDYLSYLDEKCIELEKSKIDFLSKI